MTVDIENQRRLLVPDNAKMPKWEKISKIIEKDDAKELRQQLEHETLELVARPQDSRHHKTALHAAVESPAPECLKVLLDASPGLDVLDSPDIDGNTPLHAAVKGLNSDAITKLINAGANVNLRNDQGHSPLHLLAYAAATAASAENFDKCVDALLKCPSLDFEALNNSKITPLRAAAGKMPSKTGSLVTFCQKLVQKGANIDTSTRSILDKHNFPNIPIEPTTLPQPQTATAKLLNLLILNQPEGIADMFRGVSGSQEVRAAVNCYFGSKKALYYLVDRCSETGVKALLQAGADPWSSNRNGELALHRALARGHVAIVNLLISEMKKNNRNRVVDLRHKSFSLLQKALENNKAADKTVTESYDPNKCLQRLFENDVLIDVNQKEEGTVVNQTALHIAGAMNNQEAMAILLEHGAYLGEHRMIGKQDNGTVLKALIAKTLEKTMDNCIKVPSQTIEKNEDDTLDPDYTLELNYQFLMSPTPSEPTKVQQLENEVSPLYDVSQSQEHRNSIKHPLIQTFLYAKWRKVFPLYILNLFLYMMFVILLTGFMYGLKNLRVVENLASSSNSTEAQHLEEEILRYRSTRTACMAFVLIITVYMMAKEVFQIAFTYKSYFRCIENYLEWFLIVAVLVACLVPLSVSATRHLAAWAMIAAW
ncbi:hypothetical protein HAZT_HAZT006381 [Hyalella azteca]|nr:hypothetical protein HAZT_HAZT006381 [Hyalella azteca]